mgnify:CR=1 FL=1
MLSVIDVQEAPKWLAKLRREKVEISQLVSEGGQQGQETFLNCSFLVSRLLSCIS